MGTWELASSQMHPNQAECATTEFGNRAPLESAHILSPRHQTPDTEVVLRPSQAASAGTLQELDRLLRPCRRVPTCRIVMRLWSSTALPNHAARSHKTVFTPKQKFEAMQHLCLANKSMPRLLVQNMFVYDISATAQTLRHCKPHLAFSHACHRNVSLSLLLALPPRGKGTLHWSSGDNL